MKRPLALLAADYLASYIGFFALLPVLPLLLGDTSSPLVVGLVLMTFNVAFRGGALFIGPELARMPVRLALPGSMLLVAVSLGLMATTENVGLWAVLLLLAGLGVSANGLLSRTLIANLWSEEAGRHTAFSVTQVAVNVGAALGPWIGLTLYRLGDGSTVLLAGAMTYALAALASVPLSRFGSSMPVVSAGGPVSRFAYLSWGNYPTGAAFPLVVAVIGGVCYAQLFSSFSLTANRADTAAVTLLFSLNAALVIGLQLLVSWLVSRRVRSASGQIIPVALGVATFGTSFLVLAVTEEIWGLVIFIIIFSLGETLFTPSLNAYFARPIGKLRTLESLNVKQLTVSIGEASGSLIGGSIGAIADARVPLYSFLGFLALVTGCWALVRRSTFA